MSDGNGIGKAANSIRRMNARSLDRLRIHADQIEDQLPQKNYSPGGNTGSGYTPGDGSVTTIKLADGAVTIAKLSFDPATQAELDAHAAIVGTTVTLGHLRLATDGESNSAEAVAANDTRLFNARTPTGAAGGALTGTYPNPTLATGSVVLTSGTVTGVLPSAKGGTGVSNAGTLTIPANVAITGGGTLALGGHTLTIANAGGTLRFDTTGLTLDLWGSTIIDGDGSGELYLEGQFQVISSDFTSIIGGGAIHLDGYTFTIPATGTAVLGTGVATRLPYFTNANTLTSNVNLSFDAVNGRLAIGNVTPEQRLHVQSVVANTGILLSGSTPSIVVRVERATNASGAATWFFEGSLKNTTSGLTTTGGRMGILGNTQTSPSGPSIDYLWFSASDAADTTPWSGAPLRITPAGRVGINLTTTGVPGARLHLTGTDDIIQFLIRAYSSQTARIQSWQSSGAVELAYISSIGAGLLRPLDAATNTVTTALTLGHASSGTPAAGFGTALVAQASSDSAANRDMGRLSWQWSTATDASRVSLGKLSAYSVATEQEAMRWEGGATVRLGFYGSGAVVRPGTAYTLAGTVTRTMPADPSGAYTGIDNAQAGTVYATAADLNTLRGVVSSLEGVVRQMLTDLGSTSGVGLLNA